MRQALREWVGGRLSLPAYVLEGEPFRPDVVLWLELPSQLIVWTEILDPKKSTSFAETFQAATTHPHVGAPRRPERVRIADPQLAAELRAAHPDLAVAAAPTPEIDAVLAEMTSAMPRNDDESYLENGAVSADSIARLFRAAEVLWKVAPWKDTDDSQVLRVDIPALGVEGACLSVMGALGESIGVLLFPSFAGFEAFLDAAEHPRPGPFDFGTDVLSLTFERGADLAPSLRREVQRHRWPVAGPDAYPYLVHRDRDGVLRPLVEHEVRIATAVATSLAAFFVRHGNVFAEEDGEPLCESWFDEDDLEVRLTLPYEAYSSFAITPPPRRSETAAPHVGRNDPCPCGSGRKYKKCCLRKEQAGPAGPQNVHELDRKLVHEMSRYADTRFGDGWYPGDDFVDPEAALELAIPWSVYGYHIDGQPVVDWYLAKRAQSLSSRERDWLEAQRHAWMGLWKVTAVEPGRSVTLRDHLSREERCVQEATASKTLVEGDTVLARVVDHGDTSVFCGLYPRSLPSIDAAEVVRRAQGRLRRRSAIPIERLRDEAFGRYLIARWEDAVDELDARHSILPQLYNTDGEPLLVTVDHFIFDPARRADLLARLASIDGIGDPEDDRRGHETCFDVSRAGKQMHAGRDRTLVGSIRVADGTVKVETNSVERADGLRHRVEAACGDLLRHHAREHADLLAGF